MPKFNRKKKSKMPNLLRRIAVAATLSCALGATAIRAQDAKPEGQEPSPNPEGYAPTTINVRARIVILDVVVTDKDGKLYPREDFTADDFTIYEDSVQQTIRSFEPPSKHRMPVTDKPIVNSAADLKKIGDAPVTILVVDELNTPFSEASFSRQMAVKYLQKQPAVLKTPTVLMVATPEKFVQLHDYTQDRDSLIDTIKNHMPEYPWKQNGTERMAQVLSALVQLAQSSTGTPGRKDLIWIGSGSPRANFIKMPEEEAEVISAAYKRCVDELLKARITMFMINTTPAGRSSAQDVIDDSPDPNPDPLESGRVSFTGFAADSGGYAYRGRNDVDAELGEGIDKGLEYYTMSYAPTNKTDVAGQYRGIKILMKDKNLIATTRGGYYMDTQANSNPVLDKDMKPKQSNANLQMDLSNALLSQIAYNGLEIQAAKSAEGEYTIHVGENGITWSAPGANGEEHEEATVAAAWFDAKGKIIGHVAHEFTSKRTETNNGATFKLPVTVPATAVRLRIVVRDALGAKMGTADITQF